MSGSRTAHTPGLSCYWAAEHWGRKKKTYDHATRCNAYPDVCTYPSVIRGCPRNPIRTLGRQANGSRAPRVNYLAYVLRRRFVALFAGLWVLFFFFLFTVIACFLFAPGDRSLADAKPVVGFNGRVVFPGLGLAAA